MSRQKILIADDEARLRKLVSDFLTRSGYDVIEAEDGAEALLAFAGIPDIALIVLDVMMPVKDGWEVLREIRRSSDVPVVMLTAKAEEKDELLGFELGVDEYITKPFSPKILVARIQALLRRAEKTEQAEVIDEGGIVLDPSAHTVFVDGSPVELSVKEFELLEFFLRNKGVALSRERILSSVWNYDYFGDARTIDTHVKKLRSKLGEEGARIHTVWGVGYKFE